MRDKEVIKTLSDIRNLMEKSNKFLTLSGLSSIFVGLYALAGASIAFFLLNTPAGYTNYETVNRTVVHINTPYRLQLVIGLALVLLIISLATVFLMSWNKARRANVKLKLDPTALRLLWNFFLPLLAGGILCASLLWQQHYGLTSSIMLIFYGLALINGSKYTYSNIQYLGYAQLLLGLIDSFIQGHGLLFWSIGFGVLHILYGIVFYIQYDRAKK